MNKIIFIDMDNTIAENKTCDNVEYYKGLYLNKRPIKIVIDAIRVLYPNSYYVILSKTPNLIEGRKEKMTWLKENFNDYDDRIFIDTKESKAKVIIKYISKKNIKVNECLIIDDNKITLQECKKEGISVKYPMQVICDYEELKNNVRIA